MVDGWEFDWWRDDLESKFKLRYQVYGNTVYIDELVYIGMCLGQCSYSSAELIL